MEGEVRSFKNSFEIQVQTLHKLYPSSSLKPYPLGKKDHGVDFLLARRHLWLRSKKPWAVLRIRYEVTRCIHQFFFEKGFTHIEAPVFTPTPCEGSSSLFSVPFFEDRSMYLSQSGQLYMEAAAAAFGKVYCLNPVFRAEKSSTRRHLLEFWMVEPELAFCDFTQCRDLAEELVCFVSREVVKNRAQELKILGQDPGRLKAITPPFPRLHYREACRILKQHFGNSFQEGKGLGGEEETFLSSRFEKPVFVHHFPHRSKAFYMKTDPEDPDCSLSFDLLAPGGYGEIVGGSQREDDLKSLKEKAGDHGVDVQNLKWYLDLREYGSFPHSGFGMGVERVVAWLAGLAHVREAVPFPRLYGRKGFEETDKGEE